MSNGFFKVPVAVNEPVKNYAPGSPERKLLKIAIDNLKSKDIDIPMYIGGEEIRTGNKGEIRPPHDHKTILGHFHKGDESHVTDAINAALKAKKQWAEMPWESRAAIFLKAADLLAGPYRYKMNAATMLCQSKNSYQAEIDAACELIDFLKFNVQYMTDIYNIQPQSSPQVWNKVEHRPLEGFVFALTPFNFTSIAGNLPSAPALMGNTVVWKPSNTQIYSANVIMEILKEAGLPDGVINLIYVSGPVAGKVIFSHPDFAGIHFTGSTEVFREIWKNIGNNIHNYKTYPRIVGETGGKDFVIAHKSAIPKVVSTALSRGAFEYQGQKCSAASRAYIPSNIWADVKKYLIEDIKSFKVGVVEDFSNFINAVIDENSFNKLATFIDKAKEDKDAEIIVGGTYDKSKGYFIQPTVIVTSNPNYITMEEELFGPVLTIYVYEADKFEETLDILDKTSIFALTGAIISQDRYSIELATKKLINSAGNFYINDKPTGAVVGQQPFGGARGSGTNDKAGSMFNLLRWVSQRTIKENFLPPSDYRYPFMQNE
ncbi:MAG: 1-pyrroline-5-carboxylate dehydrogenase [Bacteroidetes bacterium GWE2_29_8]|nr:MAG: 1-pyrroline-5-carboxylate dehydrogenase [Bacteroidetes bacterium GWE2_29_8]OFY19175.1 MAG: 1-pyrroline-5-carboxylate dehydrogenase [Bacteroidetes bacterium GWF2_29_10]